MGTAKATLLVDGEPLALRAARLLAEVCDPVLEVGPGYSSLPTVDEPEPGLGPLAALVAGSEAIGADTPVLLLACDLPFVTLELLTRLVETPGDGTVVPVDRDGIVQPVCARYSAAARDRARELLAEGERSLRRLLDETEMTRLADVDGRALVDVDTPDDASRWGIRRPGSLDP
jgi:molybdopterin-guanine dinucleotide biosynthesis protein A